MKLVSENSFLSELPAIERQSNCLVHVFAGPGEAVAARHPFDTHSAGRTLLAEVRSICLDELNDTDFEVSTPGARHQSECGSRLSFTVSGVNDDKSLSCPCLANTLFNAFAVSWRLNDFVRRIHHVKAF